VIDEAACPPLPVGQFTARNACQDHRSNSRCTCGNCKFFSSASLTGTNTSPGRVDVSFGSKLHPFAAVKLAR
jgi:hypothetical protein